LTDFIKPKKSYLDIKEKLKLYTLGNPFYKFLFLLQDFNIKYILLYIFLYWRVFYIKVNTEKYNRAF